MNTNKITKLEWARKAIEFVESIGIDITQVPAGSIEKSFTPHIVIESGGLLIDLENVFPGDILHEAGHLAITPPKFRPLCSGSLNNVFKSMGEYLDENPSGLFTYPEDPLSRAIVQCDDQSATAWQYAAAFEIGLPDEWLFPPGAFDGLGDEHLLRLQMNSHYGISGLRAAGWTIVRGKARGGVPVYPKLAFWLSSAGS